MNPLTLCDIEFQPLWVMEKLARNFVRAICWQFKRSKPDASQVFEVWNKFQPCSYTQRSSKQVYATCFKEQMRYV